MKENQYFTLDIEDIRIGYELEMNWSRAYETKWIPIKISIQDKDFSYTNELSEIVNALDDGMSEARVPYLNKEQIEAEGWKLDERTDEFYNRKDNKHFYKGNLSLTLFIGYLKEEIVWYSISIYNSEGVLFRGECKDINTFRYICKLLEN